MFCEIAVPPALVVVTVVAVVVVGGGGVGVVGDMAQDSVQPSFITSTVS